MTDKQIIIDGVDVSECKYFENADQEMCCELTCCGGCRGIDCYYKQLQRAEKTMQEIWDRLGKTKDELLRKEQECEELKKQNDCNCLDSCCKKQKLDQLKAELEQEKAWHKASDEISKVNSEYTVKLKAENEELKGIRDRNFLHALEEQDRADKYFKTLAEIKEIAERDKEFCIKCNGNKEIDCVDCIEGGRALLAKEILQKISECEVE